jgi:hypothetical protein
VVWRKTDSHCSPLGSTMAVAVQWELDSPERCHSSWSAGSARAALMPRGASMQWLWRQEHSQVALQRSGGENGKQKCS